jgi:hypothetical protein
MRYDVRGAHFRLHRPATRRPRWRLDRSISQTGGSVRCQSRPELSAKSNAYCAAALNWASVQQCGRSFSRFRLANASVISACKRGRATSDLDAWLSGRRSTNCACPFTSVLSAPKQLRRMAQSHHYLTEVCYRTGLRLLRVRLDSSSMS